MTVCVTVVCIVSVIAWVLHSSHTKAKQAKQEICMDKYEGKPGTTKRPTFNIQTLTNLE